MNFQKDTFIVDFIRSRLHRKQNNVIAIIGETGSGKSMASLKLGQMIDPNFNANRVCFTILQVIQLVNSGLPEGSVIVFDDAGLAIGNRMWQSTIVQLFGLLTQSFRTKFLNLIITVPKLSFIELQSRSLISLLLQHKGVQGSFLVKIPYTKTNISSKEEVTYYIYPFYKRKRIKQIYISLPSKEIIDDYEYIKMLKMDEFYKRFEEELRKIENGETNKKYEKKGYNPKSLENLKNRKKQTDNSDMYA